jgi:hypothetical protein
VKDFCERCVVYRRAKIQPQMAATLSPLHVPPRPWHTVGLDYLTHLHVRNGFDCFLIEVDHQTRMAHFMPCTYTEETAYLLPKKMLLCSSMESTDYMDYPDRDPKFVSGF